VRVRVGIAVCDRIAAPVLIGILRPIILLPPVAITGWSPDEIEMVLLHELAHVRRWDNLVNLVQRCIESLLFFHPAVWLVSNWARREREACCDAVVVGRTQRPHAYAELLVALAAQMPRSVLFHPAASSAMAAGPLRKRIRRILQLDDDPMLISGKSFALILFGLFIAAALAVLYVPSIGQAEESTTEATESTESSLDTVQATSTEEQPTTSDFPYTIRFEQGVSRFVDGDTIAISEVRGTAQTFEPGNIYRIKGTYTLASHDRAQLSAFTTAKEAKDGTGPVWKVQTTTVNRGKGTFELFFPMKVRGWPHLSFYPAGKAAGSFGDIYFGMGDSVLKEWWGDQAVIDQTAQATARQITVKDDGSVKLEGVESSGSASTIDSNKSSTDDWQKEGHYKTIEDGDIAKRAWKELGVKFIAATNPELDHIRRGGMKGGLKALDLEGKLNQSGPIIFTHLQMRRFSTGIPDFKSLNAALDELVSRPHGETVVLQGFTKGGGVVQYSIQWPRNDNHASAPSHPKFPSLEDQKLADLAFKRLKLELEPLDADDLKRVQAVGYECGLKVKGGFIGAGLKDIHLDDILVGLHVWPTTSLKDVGAVLQRDDRAELSPLKFYVIRRVTGQEAMQLGLVADDPNVLGDEPPPDDPIDVVITGRISVQFDSTSSSPNPAAGQSTEIPRDFYYYKRTKPNQPAPSGDLPPFVLPSPEDEADLPKRPPVIPGTESDSDSDRKRRTRRLTPAAAASAGKESLRYDGKTFDDWRNQWQNELSNEKRAEAVKALAAFGRAGYGKEATAAILDVAGNYDFYSFTTDDAETKLKDTIIKELVQESDNRELSKYWLPDLAARLKRDPAKWKDWVTNLLHRVYTADAAGQTLLKSLAQEGPSEVRNAALGALIHSSRSPDRKFVLDEETRELLHAALQSDDPMTVKFALQYLTYPVTAGVEPPVLLFQPELIPLLFHTDESVQRRARVCLRYLDEKDVPTVVKHLVGILQVESKQPDHRRAAIRALAAMGEKAQPAIPTLRNLVQPSADEGTLFAIFVALQEITREKYKRDFKSFNINDFMEGLGERDSIVIHEKMRGNSQRFDATVREETGSLVPQPNEQLGGGGFF
jgi:hypothetical protein